MKRERLIKTTNSYLDTLCKTIPTRRLGTQGNRDATSFFKEQIAKFGFEVEHQPFECVDSRLGTSTLAIDGDFFEIFASPFTLSCKYIAELVCAGTIKELQGLNANGKILLLHGDIAKEQLMPKGFVFYNPVEHQRIYQMLEAKQPAAILTATSKNPDAVIDALRQ